MPLPAAACLGALALELRPGAQAGLLALATAQAATLAAAVAGDLAALVPTAADCDLAVLAVHYDPVELLRPGWPLHAALAERVARAPAGGGGPRVLAFGSHADSLPLAAPEPAFAQGNLRLLPWLLQAADADAAATLAATLEEELLDRGMAGAGTALLAQDAFAAPIEHARYLTVHDLAAMMAMQYEHAGLAPLWPLIETALLAPAQSVWLDAPPEPLARYAQGEVRIALLEPEAWRAGGFAPASAGSDPVRLERAFARFEARQRQFDAVLQAHAIAVTFDHCPAGVDPRSVLAA